MIDKKLLDVLKEGNLAILPTDTVYGIHADATNTEAIRRVDEAKNSNKPHLILISSIKMLEEYILEIEPLQRKLIDKYWPGPLTILFKKNSKLSDELTKNSEYVAVRMPNDKFLLELIDTFNKPIISTSANISNGDVIKNISLLDSELKNKVSYIYNIGTIKSVPSTLIKIENNKIVFLREGILASEIKKDFKDYI
jgi:L-threonylcarbamoyladenylate synthase